MAQLVKRRAAEDKLLKKQKQNCVFANKDEKRYSEGAYFQGVLWKTRAEFGFAIILFQAEKENIKPKMN